MEFNKGSKLLFLVIGVISVFSLFFLSPMGYFSLDTDGNIGTRDIGEDSTTLKIINESELEEFIKNNTETVDIGYIRNPSFEDTTDNVNWVLFGTNIDPVIKNGYSTTWKSDGDYSMRVYGSLAVERDGYIDLMQVVKLPKDAENISADLKIAIEKTRFVSYTMIVCTLDEVCMVSDTKDQKGEHVLTVSGLTEKFKDNYVTVRLRTSFAPDAVIDGYWDNVRINE